MKVPQQQQPFYNPGVICWPTAVFFPLTLFAVGCYIFYLIFLFFMSVQMYCNFLKKVITNVEIIFIEKKKSLCSNFCFCILYNLGSTWVNKSMH